MSLIGHLAFRLDVEDEVDWQIGQFVCTWNMWFKI